MLDGLAVISAEGSAILVPAAAHLALVVSLYAWLSVERLLNARLGRTPLDRLVTPGGDQGRTARIAANLSNQFQAPMLFHMLVLTLWITASASALHVLLAWVFFGGRVLHTAVQTLSANVLARGLVFSINFMALCVMWAVFLAGAL
jgi:hypothetical protein